MYKGVPSPNSLRYLTKGSVLGEGSMSGMVVLVSSEYLSRISVLLFSSKFTWWW